MRLFSLGGYGFALAALALVVFGAYESYPFIFVIKLTAVKYVKIAMYGNPALGMRNFRYGSSLTRYATLHIRFALISVGGYDLI